MKHWRFVPARQGDQPVAAVGADTDYIFFERLILEPVQSAGITSFLAQTDGIAKAIIVVLVLMSVATWYLIATKTLQTLMTRRRTAAFLKFFWDAPSLQAVATRLEQQHPDEPFSHLDVARHSRRAPSSAPRRRQARRRRQHGGIPDARDAPGDRRGNRAHRSGPDRARLGRQHRALRRPVRHGLGRLSRADQYRHERPGHARQSGRPGRRGADHDRAGLAVAIPAVLAYNAFVRSNRVVLAQLDSFAHDLYAFLTTGSRVNDVAPVVPLKRRRWPPGAA